MTCKKDYTHLLPFIFDTCREPIRGKVVGGSLRAIKSHLFGDSSCSSSDTDDDPMVPVYGKPEYAFPISNEFLDQATVCKSSFAYYDKLRDTGSCSQVARD